jgi:DNA-binding CsgD family transcriptional regulator
MHQLVIGGRRTALRGRSHERGVVDRLLDDARCGHSGALVMRGEPGVGKTALLEYALHSASGMSVLRSIAAQSETELPFAVLHQLCGPTLDRLERLPGPQRDALGTVFALQPGAVPDRFLVGLAALTLMSDVAEERPLLCVIDDAQWMDHESAQVLGFVARRLGAESVAMIFASRERNEHLEGLSELALRGLVDADARELLRSAIGGAIDEAVCERIVAETRGNPLALLELSRGLSPAQLAGGFGLPDAPALPRRIEETFQRRLETMPSDTRLLLLVAAAEPMGDHALLMRAAERLGISPQQAVGPAEAAGLLELGARVRFRHPLVRSAVYRAAPLGDRRRAHRALADATDAEADPDRRAWHRAHGTPGFDEEVAAELERTAARAQRRGGLAAAAAFLQRAVGLTADPERGARRALAAAQVKHLAGQPEEALGLLATAQVQPLDELGRARVELLRAQIDLSLNAGSDALGRLLEVGKRLEPLDAELARETYLDGLSAATYIGCRKGGASAVGLALAALSAPPASDPLRARDLLLGGLATRLTEGYAAGAPTLKRALTGFLDTEIAGEDELRWMWLACRTAADLWDDQMWAELASRHVQLARATGALTVLALALNQRIAAHTFAGEMTAAASLIEELHAITEATPSDVPRDGLLVFAVWGREEKAADLVEARRRDAVARGAGPGPTIADWATAVLSNGVGRYAEARDAAERATRHPEDLVFPNWALPELILADVRSGQTRRAAAILGRLCELTRASGTDWALGIEALCRAVLSEGDVADGRFQEAIERLSRTRVRVELARAHLFYGEWLRRERRRVDAREPLRTALEMFTSMGTAAFAGRAERELLATGEHVQRRSAEPREELTAQELQIARLARDGLSNAAIGARLFISQHTVAYHLRKVFTKLDITSRNQLSAALPG